MAVASWSSRSCSMARTAASASHPSRSAQIRQTIAIVILQRRGCLRLRYSKASAQDTCTQTRTARETTHTVIPYIKCARTCQNMYNITSRRLPAREAHKHSAQVFLAETGGISMLRCRDVYAGSAPRQTIQAPTHVPSWMRIHVSSKNRQRKYAKPYAFLDTPYGCF